MPRWVCRPDTHRTGYRKRISSGLSNVSFLKALLTNPNIPVLIFLIYCYNFVRFKQAFVHTLPSLRVYPGLGDLVPTHPFLRCAIIYYVTRLPRPSNPFDRATCASVDRLVQRSWLAINAPSPEIDTIEALLIIASSPSKPVLDGHVGAGELELNGDRGMSMTAYHLALRLGLNDDVRRVSNHMGTAENSQSDYWPAINRLCLVRSQV